MPFLILAFFVAGLVCVGAVGLVSFYLLRRQRMGWRIGATLAATVLTAVGVWLLLQHFFGPYETKDPARLAKIYEVEFGMPLPDDVRDLKTREVVLGDSAGTWVSFRSSPATVNWLLGGHLLPSSRATFDDLSGGASTPDWWQPDQDGITTFYRAQPWRLGLEESEAVLGHSADKTRVYFMHSF